MVPQGSLATRIAGDHRHVLLRNEAPLELVCHRGVGRLAAREQHETRGVAIQPLMHSQVDVPMGYTVALGDKAAQAGHQIVGMLTIGCLARDPCGLVHDE